MKPILLVNNGYPSKRNPQYCSYVQSIEACLIDAGFPVERIVLSTDFRTKTEKFMKYLAFFWRLMRFDLSNCSVIFVHNAPYSFPLFLRGIKTPLVIHWHGTDLLAPSRVKNLLNKMTAFFTRNASLHIVPSAYFMSILKVTIRPTGSCYISPSGGLDLCMFPSRNRTGSQDVRVLGFASAIMRSKGFLEFKALIQQADRLEHKLGVSVQFKVIEYGRGCKELLEDLQNEPRLSICPPMPKEEMYLFYHELDLLVFPSQGDSLGLVALEAMACDVPVLGTNAFALPEFIIPGHTGELFEKGNEQQFFSGCLKILKEFSNYHPREFVQKKYSRERVIQQYQKIFGRFAL